MTPAMSVLFEMFSSGDPAAGDPRAHRGRLLIAQEAVE
jgi:hypothetical protein